jgi:hypothetical protein
VNDDERNFFEKLKFTSPRQKKESQEDKESHNTKLAMGIRTF